jgi:AcrR family transcriptional regulator
MYVRYVSSGGGAPALGPGRRRNLAQTRAALVEAAAEVFARKGYPQASLEEIATTAGFTRGAVHHHFSSKEELFLAIVANRDEELLAGYQLDLLGLRSDPEASAARWQELHGDARSEVALRLELRSHALRSETLRRQLVEVEGAAVEATAAHLAKNAAIQGLVWRHPPEVVAALLHAASHAAAERAALSGESSEGLMAAFTDLVWNGAFEARAKGG